MSRFAPDLSLGIPARAVRRRYDAGSRCGGWSVSPRRTRFRTRGQPKAGAMRDLSASLTAVSPGAKSEVV
jgi:hypothetical protein